VKPGYKQTEVGVIPEDWEVVPIESLCDPNAPIRYGIVQVGRNVVGGVPVVAIKHLDGRFGDELHLCDSRIESGYARSRVQAGDVLVSIKGTIGRVGVVPSGFVGNISRDLARLRPSRNTSAEYLAQQLSGPPTRASVEAATVGTTRLELSIATLRKLPALCPPPNEQRAIAEALSDADALIESLESLIAKKQQIKQGAMQELLTGKRRLPGFSGEWEQKRLGELAHVQTGSKNNQDKIDDGRYPFFVRSQYVEKINSYAYDCEAILIPGEGGIGSIFHYIFGRFDVHQRVYAITQFGSEVSGRFLYFYLRQFFGSHALENSVKATVDSLRLPTFVNFQVVLPVLAEQRAIAAVLSDLDSEVEALETKLHKARAIKQGMMQELLTGRTRLVPAEVS